MVEEEPNEPNDNKDSDYVAPLPLDKEVLRGIIPLMGEDYYIINEEVMCE